MGVSLRDRDVRALATSFVVTTLAGCAFVFWVWASRGKSGDGTLRCVTLACSVAAVHVWGLRAYRNQGETFLASLQKLFRQVGRNAAWYRQTHEVWRILAVQGVLILVGTITLDNGRLMMTAIAGSAIYWFVVLLMICTRDE